MTEVTNQPEPARTWDDVMSDAIRALTEAARLRRPPLEAVTDGDGQATVTHAGAVDWAEFVTLAVAGAVANVGSVEKALQGRPGSWEADSVRTMLASTVGEIRLNYFATAPSHCAWSSIPPRCCSTWATDPSTRSRIGSWPKR